MDIPIYRLPLTPPRSVDAVLKQVYAVAKDLDLKPKESAENKFEGRTEHHIDLQRGWWKKATTVEVDFHYGEDKVVEYLQFVPNLSHSNTSSQNDQARKDVRAYLDNWNNFCMDPNCEVKKHTVKSQPKTRSLF